MGDSGPRDILSRLMEGKAGFTMWLMSVMSILYVVYLQFGPAGPSRCHRSVGICMYECMYVCMYVYMSI